MALKLAAVLAAITPFLATDKKPEQIRAALLAADKAAKDAAGSGLGARELEEKDQAKDEADKKEARDKARDAMCAKDKKAFDAMSDEDKDKKVAKDAAEKVAAEDREDDPEGTNDEDMDADDEDFMEGSDPGTPGGNRAGGKTAIDSAEVDKRIQRAVGARDALHEALREVEPVLGKVAFDSAGAAYKAALDHLKVDTAGVHRSAYRSMLKMAKDRAAANSAPLAADAATTTAMASAIPGYGRLK